MARNNPSRELRDEDSENFGTRRDNTDAVTAEAAQTMIDFLQQYAAQQLEAEEAFQQEVDDMRARGLRLFENLLGANAGNTGNVDGNGDRKRRAPDDQTKENHDDNGSNMGDGCSKIQKNL